MHRLSLPLVVLCLAAGVARGQEEPLPFFGTDAPFGLGEAIPDPPDNVANEARLALGRRLFFDRLLSRTKEVACVDCHEPAAAWGSREVRSKGVQSRLTARHAPAIINRAWGKSFMWDGRAASLEEQVLLPIENPLEMDLALDAVIERLRSHEEYPALFRAAYDAAPDRSTLARALACFVRRLRLANSPIDRFRSARFEKPLAPAERTGLWVYESKGACWRCHSGPNFTDERHHATGIGVLDGKAEPGRSAITGDAADIGAFKTPTLRGLAFSAPYMHDGSLATLEDVVEFYSAGGHAHAQLDPLIRPLSLSEVEKKGLVAFLMALSRTE